VRVLALHPDVLLATSAIWQTNCAVVRGELSVGAGESPAKTEARGARVAEEEEEEERVGGEGVRSETFLIDSPVLPDELDALPPLLEQARFPAPSGLLATHGDWDHLLGRLAFPGVALGCAQSTAERMRTAPGEAQRELRAFDEEYLIERPRPLTLGSIQALPVPGRCGIGELELELHPAAGHTEDGMAVWVPWARVLLVGDYLSSVEIPTLLGDTQGALHAYTATLQRLRPLVESAHHVVPGHGPVLDAARALAVLEEDLDYLQALGERGAEAELPPGRRSAFQRRMHGENAVRVTTVGLHQRADPD
jgi:glyoxylase-like metal-dependent hydrolase (beta-lactamase superfamily II)